MKRNMDLIREILLNIEEQPPGEPIRTLNLPSEWSSGEVIGHLRLIEQAGLIDGNLKFRGDQAMMAIHGLSNEGHDLIDSIRSETVWAETKERVSKVGGTVALDVVKLVAGAVASKLLGL